MRLPYIFLAVTFHYTHFKGNLQYIEEIDIENSKRFRTYRQILIDALHLIAKSIKVVDLGE